MKRHSFTAALTLSAVFLSYGATSRADDTPVTATTTTTTVAQPGAQPVQATTTTTAAPYVPYTPTTERTETERTPNDALISTGITVFVLSYVPAVFAAAISERDEDKKLFIPLAGPWIDLGERDCTARECGNRESVNKAMIVTSGIAQGVGVLLGVGGLFIPERIETTRVRAATKPTLHVTPLSYAAGAGIGAVGTF